MCQQFHIGFGITSSPLHSPLVRLREQNERRRGRALKVFISWSGKKSMEIARVLKWWVKNVIQSTDPFVSDDDIALGTRWSERITHELSATTIGIICVTPENQSAPWINFEAGAISKAVEGEESKVVPLLIDFNKKTDYKGPLSTFNLALLDQEGLLKLARSINATLSSPREEVEVVETFDTWWPHLQQRLEAVNRNVPEPRQPERKIEDVASEILDKVRLLTQEKSGQQRSGARIKSGAGTLFLELLNKEVDEGQYGPFILVTEAYNHYVVRTAKQLPLELRLRLSAAMVALNPSADIDYALLTEADYELMEEADRERDS